jgi:pimeloyl-ACP methyl ester carboxylesterase
MSATRTAQVEQRTLLAADGIAVSAAHLPSLDGSAPDGGTVFVVAHGFSGSWRSSSLTRVTRVLSERAGVVAFDFRGHGRSQGYSTLGDLEVLDLDAAVHWARLLGYRSVATVGFSMGASVVIRHAALYRGVDAVVAVSGPARWYYRGTATMRRLHFLVEHPIGRLFARVAMGTRIHDEGWDPVPAEPRAVAGDVAPTPLLVVHGDQDRFFPLEHAEELAAAGGRTTELWVESGFGHAEAAIDDELTRRIAAWVRAVVASATPLHPAGGGSPGVPEAFGGAAAPVRRVKRGQVGA